MGSFRRTAVGQMAYAIPFAIRTIIGISLAVWLLELFTWRAWQPFWRLVVLDDPWPWLWQLVTYQFLHDPAGLLHLALNMAILWMFGRDLEARWGSGTFAQFFLTCGVGAGLFHVLVGAVFVSQAAPVLGASGAVLGVIVAYGMTWPERTILVMLIFPMKAKHAVVLFAILELVLAWQPANGVANLAHLGGMATGYVYLRWGWKLVPSRLFAGASGKLGDWRRARKRSKMRVVEGEWEDWLKGELDDETRH